MVFSWFNQKTEEEKHLVMHRRALCSARRRYYEQRKQEVLGLPHLGLWSDQRYEYGYLTQVYRRGVLLLQPNGSRFIRRMVPYSATIGLVPPELLSRFGFTVERLDIEGTKNFIVK